MDVVALARQDTCPADTVQFELCLGRAHDAPFSCVKLNMPYSNADDPYFVMHDYMDEGYHLNDSR